MHNLKALQLFLSVAKTSSFVQGGKPYGLSGASVSKHIKNLENELGITLFHRTTRIVALTEAGEEYKREIIEAIELLEQAHIKVKEKSNILNGTLKVNIPEHFGRLYLSTHIALFASAHPELSIEVSFDDRQINIQEENYDIVVRIGSLPDSSLIAHTLIPVGHMPIIMCASPEFTREHVLKDISMVSTVPSIIYANDRSSIWHYIHIPTREKGSVTLRRDYITNDAQMMCDFATQGRGVVLLPLFIAHPYLKSGELVHVFMEYCSEPDIGIYALFKKQKYQPAKTKLFLEHLKQVCKTLKW